MAQPLSIERRGSTALLTIDRQEAGNSISAEVIEALEGFFDAALEDTDLRAVVLTVSVLLSVVVLSATGALDLGKLLGAAGQNFLLLYAGASAALVRLSNRLSHKVLGWGCLVMVAAILAFRGPATLLYPVLLVLLALLVASLRVQMPYTSPEKQQTRESA